MQVKNHPSKSVRLLHVGVHNSANRNAGDTLLFPVVRKTFDTALGFCDWELQQAWDPFLAKDACAANHNFDGVVIGGGGLLLRDQEGSNVINSGWQWNSTVDAVQSLNIPIFVFAVGYNRFRGQDEFGPIFNDHIRAIASKSRFFGLRNTGSIDSLKRYLPCDQHGLLRRQFCPTTILWQLYPEYRQLATEYDDRKARLLAFNAAFDREHLRFGSKKDENLMNIAHALKLAQNRGWTISLAAHKTLDRQVESYLDSAGVDYETADLTDAVPEEIMEYYAKVDLAMGMRGHAQMIPFGLRRPILSLISHDKMRFFLEDIDRPQWGIELDSGDLSDRLESKLIELETNRSSLHRELAYLQENVWLETKLNLSVIGSVLSLPSI